MHINAIVPKDYRGCVRMKLPQVDPALSILGQNATPPIGNNTEQPGRSKMP